VFRSVEHLHKVLDGPIGEEILARFVNRGFIGLTFYDSGTRSIYNTVRPIKQLADMQGLRIRVQQSETAIAMVRALGAEPVVLAYGQVLTGLTTGLIDGAENNWPSYVTADHFKVAKYYTLTEHAMAPEVLIMSLKAWKHLSVEDQRIFKEAARASSLFMRRQWTALEERARGQAEAAGNLIVSDFDKTPFEAAMHEVYEKALSSESDRQMLARIRAVR
jgi:TRAP-type C4-dicarboxylate transport system substrate-binding protein